MNINFDIFKTFWRYSGTGKTCSKKVVGINLSEKTFVSLRQMNLWKEEKMEKRRGKGGTFCDEEKPELED